MWLRYHIVRIFLKNDFLIKIISLRSQVKNTQQSLRANFYQHGNVTISKSHEPAARVEKFVLKLKLKKEGTE